MIRIVKLLDPKLETHKSEQMGKTDGWGIPRSFERDLGGARRTAVRPKIQQPEDDVLHPRQTPHSDAHATRKFRFPVCPRVFNGDRLRFVYTAVALEHGVYRLHQIRSLVPRNLKIEFPPQGVDGATHGGLGTHQVFGLAQVDHEPLVQTEPFGRGVFLPAVYNLARHATHRRVGEVANEIPDGFGVVLATGVGEYKDIVARPGDSIIDGGALAPVFSVIHQDH